MMKDNPPQIRVNAEKITNCKWKNSNYEVFWFIFCYNIFSIFTTREKKHLTHS